MEAISTQFFIPITEPLKNFSEHINDINNKRIVFSAPFGDGKTFFISKFFEESHKYEAFHLYPVNYSISTNEDVFELVKFDVLFHILSKNLEYDKDTLDNFSRLEWYIYDKPLEFIQNFVSSANKLGQTLSLEVAEKLLDIYSKLNENYKKYVKNSATDDRKKIIEYLKLHSEKTGSIYEEDSVTILINSLINQLKQSRIDDNKKEIVLIIDDLDRIDPEHIFRLLNIFAAHLDFRKDENKFHFDKVIFVCDINNIKQIFSVKYGSDTNFSGYIDKFYSKEVFYFDNNKNISTHIKTILKDVTIPGEEDEGDYIKFNFSFKENNIFRESIIIILSQLVILKIINLRRLIKLRDSVYKINRSERNFDLGDSTSIDYNFDIVAIFRFLTKHVFDSHGELINLFEKASKANPYIPINDDTKQRNYVNSANFLFGLTIALIDIDANRYSRGLQDSFIYRNPEKNLEIEYKFFDTYRNRGIYASGTLVDIIKVVPDKGLKKVDLFYFLKLALEKLYTLKIDY